MHSSNSEIYTISFIQLQLPILTSLICFLLWQNSFMKLGASTANLSVLSSLQEGLIQPMQLYQVTSFINLCQIDYTSPSQLGRAVILMLSKIRFVSLFGHQILQMDNSIQIASAREVKQKSNYSLLQMIQSKQHYLSIAQMELCRVLGPQCNVRGIYLIYTQIPSQCPGLLCSQKGILIQGSLTIVSCQLYGINFCRCCIKLGTPSGMKQYLQLAPQTQFVHHQGSPFEVRLYKVIRPSAQEAKLIVRYKGGIMRVDNDIEQQIVVLKDESLVDSLFQRLHYNCNF